MKSWKGFDYARGCEVSKPCSDWKALAAQAPRLSRAAHDLLIFGADGRIIFEVYDGGRIRAGSSWRCQQSESIQTKPQL